MFYNPIQPNHPASAFFLLFLGAEADFLAGVLVFLGGSGISLLGYELGRALLRLTN